jgi:hypothetical protein
MARPTRVMAKQVTAISAISGPTAASSARGSADAVVVAARREPVTSLVGLEETGGETGIVSVGVVFRCGWRLMELMANLIYRMTRDKGSAQTGGSVRGTHRAITGRPATDLEPSALTARVELLSGEHGGIRSARVVRRPVRELEGPRDAEHTKAVRVDSPERSRFPRRCDRRDGDRVDATRDADARERPRVSIHGGRGHPDRVDASRTFTRDAIEPPTPA